MYKVKLSDIRADVEAFFHAKLYEEACIKRYNHTWDHLTDSMSDKGIIYYDPSVGKSFLSIKKGRGEHTKYLPYAFTEQELAMLSGVLNSDTAINVNISIMRAFVAIRQGLPQVSNNKELESEYNRIYCHTGTEKRRTII